MKKLAKTRKTLLAVLFALPFSASADDGLQTIKQAETTMAGISFSAVCDWNDGLTTLVIQQQQESADSHCNFKKEIRVKDLGMLMTNYYVRNNDGLWHVLPRTKLALRMDWLKLNTNSVLFGMLENGVDTSVDADYNSQYKSVDGRDVIKVSQRPKTPNGWQTQEMDFLIGRNDHVLYGYKAVSKSGAIAEMTVTKFDVLTNIPDSTFELPEGVQIIDCTNGAQYAQLTSEEVKSLVSDPAVIKNYRSGGNGRRYLVLVILIITAIPFLYYLTRRQKMA